MSKKIRTPVQSYPLTRAVLAEYRELLETALTWTDDRNEAQAMVERYFQGRLQIEAIHAALAAEAAA